MTGTLAGAMCMWALAGLAVLACVFSAVRLVAGEDQHLRLYSGSPGRLHFHRPVFHRVPGLPRDGMVTGEEEAAWAAIEQCLKKDRPRRSPRSG